MRNSIYLLVAICFLVFSMNAAGQRVSPMSSYRTIDRDSYFRFHYDNDYFTKTDRYYSQGVTLEYVNARLRNNPLNVLLLKPPVHQQQYGISFNLVAFTPTSIESDSILFGDRPFASFATAQVHSVGIDTIKKRRISSSISVGIIGPAAQGKNIQKGIHEWTGNKIPHGWEFQIKNDLLINYQVNVEKELVQTRAFSGGYIAEARLGSLSTLISGGFNMKFGHFNNSYRRTAPYRRVQYYFYSQAKLNLIGYDASLQGGLFNRNSPYVISPNDISRSIFQADAGLALHFRKVFMTYSQAFLTREFKTGVYHRWGGISLGISI